MAPPDTALLVSPERLLMHLVVLATLDPVTQVATDNTDNTLLLKSNRWLILPLESREKCLQWFRGEIHQVSSFMEVLISEEY